MTEGTVRNPSEWKITSDGYCGTLNVNLDFSYTDDELANNNNIVTVGCRYPNSIGPHSAGAHPLGGTLDVALLIVIGVLLVGGLDLLRCIQPHG
jgi:hypothetical protein